MVVYLQRTVVLIFFKNLIKFNPFYCIQNSNNNFIDFIFDMKISVPERSIQWQIKQSKIKVKKERKKVTTTQTQNSSWKEEEGRRRTIRASPPNLKHYIVKKKEKEIERKGD